MHFKLWRSCEWIASCSLSYKIASQFFSFFYLLSKLISKTYLLSILPLNTQAFATSQIVSRTFLGVVKDHKCLRRTLFEAFQPLKTIRAHSLFRFNFETNHSYFASCLLTTKYVFSTLNVIWTFKHISCWLILPLKPWNGKQQSNSLLIFWNLNTLDAPSLSHSALLTHQWNLLA